MLHCYKFVHNNFAKSNDVWHLSLSFQVKVRTRGSGWLNVKIFSWQTIISTCTSASRRPKTLELEISKQKTVYTLHCYLLSDSLCSLSPQSCWWLVPSRLDREMTVHHYQQVSDHQVLALIKLSRACDLCHTTTASPRSARIFRNMENWLAKSYHEMLLSRTRLIK